MLLFFSGLAVARLLVHRMFVGSGAHGQRSYNLH